MIASNGTGGEQQYTEVKETLPGFISAYGKKKNEKNNVSLSQTWLSFCYIAKHIFESVTSVLRQHMKY